MDVVPRSSYVSGIVKADERTFTMGVVNVVKSLSSACGPLVTTSLGVIVRFVWALYLIGGCGVCEIGVGVTCISRATVLMTG